MFILGAKCNRTFAEKYARRHADYDRMSAACRLHSIIFREATRVPCNPIARGTLEGNAQAACDRLIMQPVYASPSVPSA